MLRLILISWLSITALGLVLWFFAGLAYCLLMVWFIHLIFTSAYLNPRLARFLIGDALFERNGAELLRQGKTKWYRAYWLFTNIGWLGIAVFSFKINFRLVDIVQYLR